MKKDQVFFSGLLAVIFTGLIASVLYLLFVLPKVVDRWKELNKTLSLAEKLLLSVADLCASYWMLILPLLIFPLWASVIWMIGALTENGK